MGAGNEMQNVDELSQRFNYEDGPRVTHESVTHESVVRHAIKDRRQVTLRNVTKSFSSAYHFIT